MNKNQAIALINNRESEDVLTAQNTHWANLSLYNSDEGWWLNIPFNKFRERLHIILNNEESEQFVLVVIPENAIIEPRSTFRNKEDTADIFISDVKSTGALVDTQSKGTEHNFSVHQVELIDYSSAKNDSDNLYPEEVSNGLKEGSKKTVTVNAYERNPKARLACINKYGVSCVVCDFTFENIYGERGKGFIHVHHLIAVSEIGDEYEIDPIKDLRPVCPNCHAMLHRMENISIEELKDEIESNK